MNLQELDAIIFDFDGVIVESVNVKTQAFGALYSDYGQEVVSKVENYHLRNAGVSRFDKFRYFQTEILGGPPLDDREVADLAEAFSGLVMDKVVAAPMVQGAQEFLACNLGRVPMFVVSGTPTFELGQIIERRNLGNYFVGFWGSPANKTANTAELLQKHGLSASRCVMIGDAIADYEGAVSNSVSFLGRVPESDENCFADDVITFVDFLDFPTSWI